MDEARQDVIRDVRGAVTTNTVEGAFSICKRGEQHRHRYPAEFDFGIIAAPPTVR